MDAKLYFPAGLALDPQGNLYIADQGNGRVRKVNPAGIITTAAGGGGTLVCPGQAVPATSAQVAAPIGVAVDGQGNLFFNDAYGVLRLAPDGMVTRAAGQCQTGFTGDGGPATSARLEVFPQGIAVDGQGNL